MFSQTPCAIKMTRVLEYNLRDSRLNYLLLIFIVFLNYSCHEKKDTSNLMYQINCDVSDAKNEKNHKHKTEGFHFQEIKLGGIKSEQNYHSSPSSILLTGKSKYAFTTVISSIERNQFMSISIWRKDALKKSDLIVTAKPDGILYHNVATIAEQGEDGWEKIHTEIEVPPGANEIIVFAFLGGSDSAFFDDLKINVYQKKEYPKFEEEQNLHLYFTDRQMMELEAERKEAFSEGVHFSNDKWHKAVLSDEKIVYPIKARLKGDWLDHLTGRKWSFRVKMRDDNAFKRMKSFSVQTPASRYFLHEFIAHRLFAQEDILTTRYSFVPLFINTENVGLYAIEEHFAKQLIEFNKRREGPIIKFDEDPFWSNTALGSGVNKIAESFEMPYFEVSRILPFSSGKLTESNSLMHQFSIAHSLAYQYKNTLGNVEEVFDIDKMAKFFALTDIINGKHGLAWHNQRFYYNPVTCKLEPINYDNFVENFSTHANAIPVGILLQKTNDLALEDRLSPYIFSSDKFFRQYIQYLEKYSDNEFILDFYNRNEKDVLDYLELIQAEFPSYDIDVNYFLKNAADIRNHLPQLKKRYETGFFKNILPDNKPYKTSSPLNYERMLSVYLNCYFANTPERTEVLIENFNGLPIEIMALLDKNRNELIEFTDPIRLEAYEGNVEDTILKIANIKNVEYISFNVLGESKTHFAEITPWPKSIEPSPYQKLLRSKNSQTENLFMVKGDSLILEKGNYTLKEKIYVPEGKVVLFRAGVNLDLVKEASILSYSKVHLKGKKNLPINIYSSDRSANGFNVFQTEGKSTIEHTVFSGLNTLNFDGWQLTGAINFYEADVSIHSTVFKDNQCEDALNIIRSDFTVTNCQFLNIYADAFDSDFCKGKLSNSIFDGVGNDAIDFSTSQIDISQCRIRNITDKGISGGEESSLNIWDCEISKCTIGIASKDLSIVNVSKTSIEECEYGFVALRKKTEYGPAKIIAKSVSIKNCSIKHLIEHSSELILNKRRIAGTEKNVAARFY